MTWNDEGNDRSICNAYEVMDLYLTRQELNQLRAEFEDTPLYLDHLTQLIVEDSLRDAPNTLAQQMAMWRIANRRRIRAWITEWLRRNEIQP